MRGNSLGLRPESRVAVPRLSHAQMHEAAHGNPPWCPFHACILSTSACWFVAHWVALITHATTDRWYMSHLGSTSSLCFIAVIGPLFLSATEAKIHTQDHHPLLRGGVIFATLQLVLPSYRMHEVKSYWSWKIPQRIEYNKEGGQVIVWVDTAHMLFVVIAGVGLALERSLMREGIKRASALALGISGVACASLQALLYPIDDGRKQLPVNETLISGILLTVALSVHYVWRSRHPMVSYVGVFAVVSCFLATVAVYGLVYAQGIWTMSPRPTDVWANAYHFFAALVIGLHVHMTDTPCIRGWKLVTVLFVVIFATHMSVFLNVPHSHTRVFFIAFDSILLVETGILVGVSWRYLKNRAPLG